MKQLAIIKIPGLSKAATMEVIGNYLSDTVARQAALNSQIIQIWECSSLPTESIKIFYSSNRQLWKTMWQQNGEHLSQANKYGLDPVKNQSYLQGLNYLYINMYMSWNIKVLKRDFMEQTILLLL